MGKVIYLYNNERGNEMEREEQMRSIFNLLKMISYYCNNSSQKLYKTKLNKLLFYTQFLYYKSYNEKLLEYDFVCDYFGPVLDNLDKYLSLLEELEFISLKDTIYGTTIESSISVAKNEYSREERRVMQQVLKKFDNYTAREISEYSHKESLWKDTSLKSIINIDRACELYGI